MNAMPKYVVSKTLHDPAWNNTTVLSGDPVAEITALTDKVARDILVAGSSQLVHLLATHDLVDQYNLMSFRCCSARAGSCSPTRGSRCRPGSQPRPSGRSAACCGSCWSATVPAANPSTRLVAGSGIDVLGTGACPMAPAPGTAAPRSPSPAGRKRQQQPRPLKPALTVGSFQ